MFDTQTNPWYRTISILTLIHSGVVIYGVLAVNTALKAAGYGQGQVPEWFFNSAAVWVRNLGFLLLSIPVCWALLAIVLARLEVNRWIQLTVITGGIGAIICELKCFGHLALNPYIL